MNSGDLIEQLRHAGPSQYLLRRLQRFSINVHSRIADQMRRDGLLEEVWPGFLAQCSFSIYSDIMGLEIFKCEIPVEDLVGV
jgi:hypothetical protein